MWHDKAQRSTELHTSMSHPVYGYGAIRSVVITWWGTKVEVQLEP